MRETKAVMWRSKRKVNQKIEWQTHVMDLEEMKKELKVNNAQYNAVYERFMDKYPEVSSEEHKEFVRVEGLLNFRGVMLRAQMQKFFGDVQWFEKEEVEELVNSSDEAKL